MCVYSGQMNIQISIHETIPSPFVPSTTYRLNDCNAYMSLVVYSILSPLFFFNLHSHSHIDRFSFSWLKQIGQLLRPQQFVYISDLGIILLFYDQNIVFHTIHQYTRANDFFAILTEPIDANDLILFCILLGTVFSIQWISVTTTSLYSWRWHLLLSWDL